LSFKQDTFFRNSSSLWGWALDHFPIDVGLPTGKKLPQTEGGKLLGKYLGS
jgi:hypothetical protein